MIDEPTTLILGAGASAPYGYPLGGELVDRIISQLLLDGDSGALYQALIKMEHRSGDISEFGVRLRDSGLRSIDAFLEGNSATLVQIGKAAIAHTILRFETKEAFFRHPPDQREWYEYLWNLLRPQSTASNLKDNHLSIVTFNYDRSFEYFFITAIKNTFGIPSWRAAQEVFRSSVPVVHLHGVVGEADGLGHHPKPLPLDILWTASREIRVVHDAIPEDDAAFREAWNLLSDARRVGFLGFGFHPTNIARLRLKEICTSGGPGKQVFGSAFGMGGAEIGRAEAALGLGRVLSRDVDHDALECLRQLPIFV